MLNLGPALGRGQDVVGLRGAAVPSGLHRPFPELAVHDISGGLAAQNLKGFFRFRLPQRQPEQEDSGQDNHSGGKGDQQNPFVF